MFDDLTAKLTGTACLYMNPRDALNSLVNDYTPCVEQLAQFTTLNKLISEGLVSTEKAVICEGQRL